MKEELAVNGGKPVRADFLPLTRPWIGEEEKQEVLDTLSGIWLSRGPKVSQFEEEFKAYIILHGGTSHRHRGGGYKGRGRSHH